MKRFIGSCLLLVLFVYPSFAQTAKINQLQLKLNQAKEDTTRLRLLQQIGDAYTAVDPAKKLYYANLFMQMAPNIISALNNMNKFLK